MITLTGSSENTVNIPSATEDYRIKKATIRKEHTQEMSTGHSKDLTNLLSLPLISSGL